MFQAHAPNDSLRASLAGFASILASCSGGAAGPVADPVTASIVVDVVGVPDRGLDPSVVALTNSHGETCTGVLLANDVVLTARHCVMDASVPVTCGLAWPAASPATVHVFTGVPGPSVAWASVGAAILTSDDPSLCGADVAIVILESPLQGVPVSVVSESGMAQGGYVRTVGLGWPVGALSAMALLREHLPVLSVSGFELAVGEATCVATGGSPAFDETTGQIVGILSRWGSQCGGTGEFDVFTRADGFSGLVKQALVWAPTLASAASTPDGGLRLTDGGRVRDAGHTKKPLTDIGAACSEGAECGTGVCVTVEGSQYCSRSCTPFDSCPTDFKCVVSAAGESVCVHT